MCSLAPVPPLVRRRRLEPAAAQPIRNLQFAFRNLQSAFLRPLAPVPCLLPARASRAHFDRSWVISQWFEKRKKISSPAPATLAEALRASRTPGAARREEAMCGRPAAAHQGRFSLDLADFARGSSHGPRWPRRDAFKTFACLLSTRSEFPRSTCARQQFCARDFFASATYVAACFPNY